MHAKWETSPVGADCNSLRILQSRLRSPESGVAGVTSPCVIAPILSAFRQSAGLCPLPLLVSADSRSTEIPSPAQSAGPFQLPTRVVARLGVDPLRADTGGVMSADSEVVQTAAEFARFFSMKHRGIVSLRSDGNIYIQRLGHSGFVRVLRK